MSTRHAHHLRTGTLLRESLVRYAAHMPHAMVQHTLRMPPEEYNAIVALAAQHKVSISAILRRMIEDGLKRAKQPQEGHDAP